MKSWRDISLFQFQEIDRFRSRRDLDEIDKTLFSVCSVFGLTEFELDEKPAAERNRLIDQFTKVFSSEFKPDAKAKIGPYIINYDISSMTAAQYVELAFFNQHEVQNAHYILASTTRKRFRKHNTEGHSKRAEYFLQRPVTEALGSVALIKVAYQFFNIEFPDLFSLNPAAHDQDEQAHPFHKRYGWIHSVEQVAKYERISNEQAFALPVRQFLNDLSYLKEKGNYEHWLFKKQTKK